MFNAYLFQDLLEKYAEQIFKRKFYNKEYFRITVNFPVELDNKLGNRLMYAFKLNRTLFGGVVLPNIECNCILRFVFSS